MNPAWLVPELVVIGVGVGVFRTPNHRALFGAVPRSKLGQAGGYQHLPRQLGESVGETGVVTMFTGIVLASAALAGFSTIVANDQPAVVASQAVAPTPVAPLGGVQPRLPVIQAYQPAAVAQPAAGQAAPAPNPATT